MTGKEIQKGHARLLANLQAIQRQFKREELAELIGVSCNTWTARMKEPWRLFSYDNLRSIARYCRIDFVALVDGVITLR